MSRYIDADRFINAVANTKSFLFTKHQIMASLAIYPTADVKEVVHGEWILKSEIQRLVDDYDEYFYVECSVCHRREEVPFELEEEKMLTFARNDYPFCHCGADMRGENSEDN